MRALLLGHDEHRNEAFPIVMEYMHRERLARIGFTVPLSAISVDKAMELVAVASEIDSFKKDQYDKMAKKKK